jgi:hypothetical protein
MLIYGLSQSTGHERVLEVEKADTSLLLYAHDQPESPAERILVSAAEVVAALSDATAGVKTISGVTPVYGRRQLLDLEVRRNEVLLWVRPEAGGGWDVAVGFDDFQDAVEAVM